MDIQIIKPHNGNRNWQILRSFVNRNLLRSNPTFVQLYLGYLIKEEI